MTAEIESVTPIAAAVHGLRTGWWRLASNVYFVESGASWVLVDAGWHGSADVIRSATERLFGRGTRPAAILLTTCTRTTPVPRRNWPTTGTFRCTCIQPK